MKNLNNQKKRDPKSRKSIRERKQIKETNKKPREK